MRVKYTMETIVDEVIEDWGVTTEAEAFEKIKSSIMEDTDFLREADFTYVRAELLPPEKPKDA